MIHSSDLLVWGNNQCGLLSKSTTKCLSTPIPLNLPYDIVSICASQKHISFVTKNGQLYSYGSNLDGRLGISTKYPQSTSFLQPIKVDINGKVLRAESGFSHMCILTDKMQLYSWGLGDYGALGTGQFKFRSTPTKVQLQKEVMMKLRQISCGAMHTAFLTEEGDVYACGSNQYGEIGSNQPQKVATPILLSFHLPVRQVSCGVFYTLLLTRDGKVFGMGNNKYGQLGTGHKINQNNPTLIKQMNDIIKVTAGYHSGAIDKYGNLYIWGSGSFGELLKPKKYVLSIPIRDVAIRGFFGVAIGHTSKNQNRIYCWGNNSFGELGIGNYQPSKDPQQLQILRGLEINKVALGVNFAIVLLHPPKSSRGWEDEQVPLKHTEQHRLNEEHVYGNSDRRSIAGFEQNYLNTNRKSGESSHSENYRRKQYIGENYGNICQNRSKKGSQQKNGFVSTLTPLIGERQRYHNIQLRRNHKLVDNYSSQANTHKDYEHLFLNLSQDYEVLTERYKQLEKQLQIAKAVDKETVEGLQRREKQLLAENATLKEQISKLRYEFASEKQKMTLQQTHLRNFVSGSLSADLEQQYNKLLTQKQQLITRLNLSMAKSEQQFKIAINQLSDDCAAIKNQLAIEMKNNQKVQQEYKLVINELEIQIRKSQKLTNVLKEENDQLKFRNQSLSGKIVQLEEMKNKNREIEVSDIFVKEKYEKSIKDSQIRTQMMSNRIAQLQVQLKYERDFNKKYQQCISQLKKQNEMLHHELNSQSNINIQNVGKMENYLRQIENWKGYKKQLDDRNFQMQQLLHDLDSYKKKSKELLTEKQVEMHSYQDSSDRIVKQCEEKLVKKNNQIEEILQQNRKLVNQINQVRENLVGLKTEISVKDDQLEHIHQQKITMEKKINRLMEEINKDVEERDELVKDSGESKRELTRLKLANVDLQSQRDFELEEKTKLQQMNNEKNMEIGQLKQEIKKMKQYCENLTKENKLFREENQQIRYQIQSQTKINEELVKTNREFASNESVFTRRTAELQGKLFELESQNKSYTPRYDALMIRNRELDQRNRELSQMINKAIEFQAQSYKNNILKEVQLNTDNIINQIKQQRQFKPKNNRNKNKPKETEKEIVIEDEQPITIMKRSQENGGVVSKEQPYTKMMKQRINQHRRKVSESAQKLVSILQLNENDEKSSFKGISSVRDNMEDYEKINLQMESFSNQKQEFISKIHSFAEKLKII